MAIRKGLPSDGTRVPPTGTRLQCVSSVGAGSLRCSQVFRLQADFDEFMSPNSMVWDLYFMGLEPVVTGEWKFKSSLSDTPAPTSQSPAGHSNSARLDHRLESPRETLSEL